MASRSRSRCGARLAVRQRRRAIQPWRPLRWPGACSFRVWTVACGRERRRRGESLAFAFFQPLLDRTAAVRDTPRAQPNELRSYSIPAMSEKGWLADSEPIAHIALTEQLLVIRGTHRGPPLSMEVTLCRQS